VSVRPVFDPSDPRLIADPYPLLAQLRTCSPLTTMAGWSGPHWVLSRYDDVHRMLNDPSAHMREGTGRPPAVYGDGPAAVLWDTALSMMDPPDHTRVRAAVTKALPRQRMNHMRGMIRDIATDLVDATPGNEPFDAVPRLALALPMRVICGLLGVPQADWPMLQGWTADALRLFMPEANTAPQLDALQSAARHFIDYFAALVRERRRNPGDDVVTSLSQLETAGEITPSEVIGVLRGLLTAGFETTAATVAAIVDECSRRPGLLASLGRADADPAAAADEFLRWETPVQMVYRRTDRPVTFQGVEIEAGVPVVLLLGAANRDASVFNDADTIIVRRKHNPHVSFGGGRHACFGAQLARVELREFIAAMATRWRELRPEAPDAVRRQHFQFRSIASLPISVVRQ
jgi:cytochrome P450